MSRFRVMLVNTVSKGHTRRFADAFLIIGMMWIASFARPAPSRSFHACSSHTPTFKPLGKRFSCCDLQRKLVTHFSALAAAVAIERRYPIQSTAISARPSPALPFGPAIAFSKV
jgi:hypothetical protein